MKWKIIGVISIIILFVILIVVTEPRLIERGLYRIGIQDYVCEPIDKSEISENSNRFVFSADFGTENNGIATLKSMEAVNPDLYFFVGDLSYKTPEHWFNQTKFIEKNKTYIAFADEEYQDKDAYLDFYNLERVYYLLDFESAHFIVLTSEESLVEDSPQYNFLVEGLSNIRKNSENDWIIIIIHAPIYSSDSSVLELRNYLQPVFDKYNVDLIINGDVHGYERTYPLAFNEDVKNSSKCAYDNPQGQIFVTIGTGGHSHSPFIEQKEWSVIQNDNDFGFLNIELFKENKILIGEFISNSGKIVDSFQITK